LPTIPAEKFLHHRVPAVTNMTRAFFTTESLAGLPFISCTLALVFAISDVHAESTLPESSGRLSNRGGVVMRDAQHQRPTLDSVVVRARDDLNAVRRKAATRDPWIALMQIGGISLLASIADRSTDRYAVNHGSSTIMTRMKNIGNALPLAAIGYSSAMLLMSDEDSLAGRTSYDALAAGGIGFASALGLKYATGRARPSAEKGSASFTPLNPANGNTSWPSIHTTVMWAMVTPYAKAYDAPWLYGVAAATNAARVAGRDHWFSDTVAGSLLGYEIGNFIWNSHQRSDYRASLSISPNQVTLNWKFE
jgi:membrane-associated phospholipid phosphatase